MDQVRVVRIIEYVGPRDKIEEQIARSMGDGTHRVGLNTSITIRIATLGNIMEILDQKAANVVSHPSYGDEHGA